MRNDKQALRFVVNTRLLLNGKLEGIGRFSFETLKRIVIQHPEHTFYFVFDRAFAPEFIFAKNVVPIVAGPQARHPLLFIWWFEVTIPRILKKYKADLFLSPDGYLSLRSCKPQISVMHDLNFEHFPKDLPKLVTWYLRFFFPRFARKAARIATVSQYSKKDIESLYGISSEKIDVVYNGISAGFSPIHEDEKANIKNIYTQGQDYFVYVGAIHPRKNLKNLFLAFDQFKQRYKKPFKLLIVGAKKWWTDEMQNTLTQMEYCEDVIFTGRVSERELHHLLAAAKALSYVSYFEGFGIPLVEAFACNIPVITSNVTSMPEIAGNAALLVDPFSPPEIAEAMWQLATDDTQCKELVQRGSEQLNLFSWDKSADLLWQCIEKTAIPPSEKL